jgi:peptidoglycan/xylan/chitin deacetylase (PgdA/CDA1 family)
MIHRTPFFLPWLYRSLLWRIPTENNELYLTFDDGPVPGPTEFVLDTLKGFDAKATFFCIGENIRKHPSVFKKIVEANHAVGNHTYNHLNGWKTNAVEYQRNVLLCQDEIQKFKPSANNATTPAIFRPPYGRITRDQVRRLSENKIVMWDVLSVDYNKNITPEKCLKNTIQASRKGSIVVFHDSYKAERNLNFVLPRLMDHFFSQGWSFKSIPS